MEVKKFHEYTKEEQNKLMMHWWHYYGKVPFTPEELNKFSEYVENDLNLMWKVAVVSYIRCEASQGLINAMRNGNVLEYFDLINVIVQTNKYKKLAESVEDGFIGMLVESYNNPEPDIPLTDEQIAVSLRQIKESENYVLTSDKVRKLYLECLLKEEEIKDEAPVVDFTIAEGIKSVTVFNWERLEANKDNIVELVNELPNLDRGPSFLTLCEDKNGRQWTGDQRDMDLLVQLGLASDLLLCPLPREFWNLLPGRMPYIVKNFEKDKVTNNRYKPHEYKKVIDEVIQKVV